jgi:hypothetical protein
MGRLTPRRHNLSCYAARYGKVGAGTGVECPLVEDADRIDEKLRPIQLGTRMLVTCHLNLRECHGVHGSSRGRRHELSDGKAELDVSFARRDLPVSVLPLDTGDQLQASRAKDVSPALAVRPTDHRRNEASHCPPCDGYGGQGDKHPGPERTISERASELVNHGRSPVC